jgi:hypothetical protein
MKKTNNNVIIYAKGLCCCSVCVPQQLTSSEIKKNVNYMNPTGINSLWKISSEKFSSGDFNPCKCNTDKNRLHYLLTC